VNWTTTKPTAPGWYWMKWPENPRTEVVLIHAEPGRVTAFIAGTDAAIDLTRNSFGTEWYGPLEAPTREGR
jgi:hypothetical protein